MDNVTLERIKTIHPKLRIELQAIYKEIFEKLKGTAECRFTHVLRTIAEQDALYAQGRTKSGKIVTWAKGGDSYHNYGLAVDVCLIGDFNGDKVKEASWDTLKDFDGDHQSDWREIVEVFLKYGWSWGGNWNKPKTDNPHFEKTMNYSIQQLKTLPKDEKGYPKL